MERERRYRVVGGVAAWRIPVLFGFLTAVATAAGEWSIACALAAGGVLARAVEQGAVFVMSDRGLARGFVIGSAFVGPAPTLAWESISEISTTWLGGCDCTGLETIIHARDGATLRFSSLMGLAAFQALLGEVNLRAPAVATRSGLTRQVLEEARQPAFPFSHGWAAALSMILVLALLALAA